MDIVFLNGEYVPRDRAVVSADDRGFVFGDGVYEVTPVYGGRALRMGPRLDRLRGGLAAVRIEYETAGIESIYAELLSRNGLSNVPTAVVYFQVTRGVAKRTHAFPPPGTLPTVYAYANPLPRPHHSEWEAGTKAATVPDTRWGRVDIKTVQLLPNVLAQEAARRAGADEAILIRDGIALEGARSNLFVVLDGVVRTHPPSNQILSGISRQLVLEIARGRGYDVHERATPFERLGEASEVFLTGSTTDVLPIVSIDGIAVGDGRVGPVARDLRDGFLSAIAEECEIDLRSVSSG
jgi:D-alanine transaminase